MFTANFFHLCKFFISSSSDSVFVTTTLTTDLVMNNDELLFDSVRHNGNGSDDQQNQPCSSQGSSNNVETYGISRHNLISSGPTLDYDSMTDVVIDDIADEPTSAILDYCKRKFLRPYVHILGLVGIRPMTVDTTRCQGFLSHLQTIIVFFMLCSGYFLQYFTGFRRDRGFNQSGLGRSITIYKFYYKEAYDIGELLFVYIIPGTLHLCAFASAIYVFRIADNEQFQNLVERVFLLTTAPRKLCIALWMYVMIGMIWLAFLCAYVVLLSTAQSNVLQIEWYHKPSSAVQLLVKISLITTIFVHDFVQMVVLISYCIECYLLRLHLRNLKEKLIQHTIETLDWMREVLEFRKLLNHLNQKVATPICFFTILNLAYALAGIVYLFKEYNFDSPIKIFSLSIANLVMWLFLGLVPFFQAASVTRACKATQASGHQIRVRPFVYHNTSSDDLDSTLMFASSLNMSAKLFRMPILINYLCFSVLIVSLVILTLGMCLNVSLGII